jgi:O-antigen/teichoic acid export membrane protein
MDASEFPKVLGGDAPQPHNADLDVATAGTETGPVSSPDDGPDTGVNHGSESSGGPVRAQPGVTGGSERLLRALVTTLATQVVVAGATLLVYRLIANRFGTSGFGSYALMKQAVGLLFPVVSLGLVGGLPRTIALYRSGADEPTPSTYTSVSVVMCTVVVLPVALAAIVVPDWVASVLFGNPDDEALARSTVAMIAATAFFYMAYGYYRGRLRLGTGNALHVLSLAIAPPVIVLLAQDAGVASIVAWTAACVSALSLAAIGLPVLRGLSSRVHTLRRAASTLLGYGLRRVPGEAAQTAVFALVPIVAGHAGSLTDVAFLASGLQVFSIVMVALNPIGLVLMPALAKGLADDPSRARQQVGNLSAMAVHVAMLVGPLAFLYADLVVRIWLGEQWQGAAPVIRILVVGLPFFAYYLTVRGPLDAASVRAYNSRATIVALVTFAAMATLGLALTGLSAATGVAIAFAGAAVVEGTISFMFVRHVFGIGWREHQLRIAVPLALGAVVIGGLLRPFFEASLGGLVVVLLLQLALACAYVVALHRAGVAWVATLADRIPMRRGPAGV